MNPTELAERIYNDRLFAVHGYVHTVTRFARETCVFLSAGNAHASHTHPSRRINGPYEFIRVPSEPDSTFFVLIEICSKRFGEIDRVRRVVSVAVRRTPVETSH